MQKKKNISDADFRETAQKVRDAIERELPILEQNLRTMESTNNFMVIPLTVHNICIILERQAYKFLRPALNLYSYMDSDNLRQEHKAEIRAGIDTLKKLSDLEKDLVSNQEAELVKAQADARKKKRPFNPDAEREAFNHFEGDLSSFFRTLFSLIITDNYYLTPDQKKVLDETRLLCIEILKEAVNIKRQALHNTKKVLAQR